MQRTARVLGVILSASASIMAFTASDAAGQQPQAAPACTTPKTTCEGADGYYVSYEDKEKLVSTVDPILRELKTCLDSVGAKISPSVLIRFDENGKAATSTVEAPGFENQLCVARIVAKLSAVTNPRETKVRCDFGCPKAEAPSTPPAPVTPVPPPTTTTTTAPPPPPPAPKKPGYHEEKVWYGYQTLIADAFSIGLIAGGIGSNQGSLGYTGLAAFLLATPVVHMVHGNIGPGFASIGMRILIPPTTLGIGALIGLIVGSRNAETKGEDVLASSVARGVVYGSVAGFLTGVAICVGLDAGVFGFEKVKVEDHAALRAREYKPRLTLTPIMDVQPNRASVGIGGTF